MKTLIALAKIISVGILISILIFVNTSCVKFLQSQLRNKSKANQVMSDETVRENFNNNQDEKLSKEWPSVDLVNFPEKTLGNELQNIFKDFTKNKCNCSGINSNESSDYIPSNFKLLINSPDLNSSVIRINKMNIKALMYYPFSETERDSFDTKKINGGTIIQFGNSFYSIDVSPFKQLFDNFFYSSSCSNYVQTKLDASTGKRIPIVSLKGALKSDKEFQTTIIGYGGDFVSPLYEIFSDNKGLTSKINLYGKLWKFYTQTSDPEKKWFLLRNLEAATFNMATGGKSSFILQGQGVLNVEKGFGNINAETKAGLARSESFDASSYTILVSKKPEVSNYFPMPSPQDIQNLYSTIKPNNLPLLNPQNINQFIDHQHELIFEGLPEEFKDDNWDITFDDKVFESCFVRVDKNHPNQNECKLVITGKPRAELFQDRTRGSVVLNYLLTRPEKVSNAKIGFRIENLIFKLSNEPNILDKEVSQSEFLSNIPTKKLSWTFDINFQDALNLVNFQNVSSSKIEIVPPLPSEGSYLQLIGKINSGNLGTKTMNLTLTSNFDPTKVNTAETLYVDLDAKITFTLKSSPVDAVRFFKLRLPTFKLINTSLGSN